MDDQRKIKVRYLIQGILTIPEEEIPTNLETMTKEEKWDWLNEWWDLHVTETMVQAGLVGGIGWPILPW